ncbi:MAG: radical SAM protein [Patescibacteria group bacterium]|nr:radical SAM protein [Patescibacteria group bacterium]
MQTLLRESPVLVIMRPTESCNLDCRYCYNAYSAPEVRMSEETLENSIRAILSYYRQTIFLWHGGESTLMGVDFFKQALDFQEKYKVNGQKIVNEIQTNGTLLNEKWCDFFAENNFYVGVSIDGPQYLNDKARRYKNSNGTHKDILKGILMLKERNIIIAGVCVLAQHNVEHLAEVVDFYRGYDIPLNLNPFVSSGQGSIFREELTISPRRYALVLIELFNKWFENPDIKIYEFWKIVKSMFTGYNNICCYSGECSRDYLSICPTGEVYPCGRWAGEKGYCMGNVNFHSISQIVQSKPVVQILERKHLIEECQQCFWYEICHGGCPHTAYVYTGNINNSDYYCCGRKMLFSHIYQKLRMELKSAVNF